MHRFTVNIKANDSTKAVNKNLYKICGNSQIEVGPSGVREYNIHFFCYVTIDLNFTVSFKTLKDIVFFAFKIDDILEINGILKTLTRFGSHRNFTLFHLPVVF